MTNYWMKQIDRDSHYVFQTTFGKNEYPLPSDCEEVIAVYEITGYTKKSVNWRQQSKNRITLIPTPTTRYRVIVEYVSKSK
jgi:hypothetical protein